MIMRNKQKANMHTKDALIVYPDAQLYTRSHENTIKTHIYTEKKLSRS